MRTLGFNPFDKARMAFSIWAWPATTRRTRAMRLLERRVAATRFGVNSPRTLHRLSVDEKERAPRTPTLP